jgi:pilus assembly protein Flp/PilA
MLQFISTLLARFSREDEEGQTLVEYGLLLALIAIIVIVALLFLGPIVSQIFSNVAENLQGLVSGVICAPTPPGSTARGRRQFRPGSGPSGAANSRLVPPSCSPQVHSKPLDAVRRLLTAVTMLRGLIHSRFTRFQRRRSP